MENLERYARKFDIEYPDYAEARYSEIARMIERYDNEDAEAIASSAEFQRYSTLIQPLITIKNYKSQVPFPEDIGSALSAAISIRKAKINPDNIFDGLQKHFKALEKLQGYQLPTISAVFHFCHPDFFPIVDRNVQTACEILIDRNPSEFENSECPVLPSAGTSVGNKLKKYKQFISLIDQIIQLHPESPLKQNYRSMDKALMVLGSGELRKKVENENVAR